jgi:hypothetical protein
MKSLLIIMGMILSVSSILAKNDTFFISDTKGAIPFDAYFVIVFTDLAKDDIRSIKELDKHNYPNIISEIKRITRDELICDPNSVIPILKQYGSLRHILAYKKMFMIYFRQFNASKAWAKQVYYITDHEDNLVYVEFKNVFHGKHMVFDHVMLKDIKINKTMLREAGLKI